MSTSAFASRSLVASVCLALTAPAFAVQYVPCPNGLYTCGQLKDPGPDNFTVVSAVCDPAEYAAQRNRACHWDDYLGKIISLEAGAQAIFLSASTYYTQYPQKAAYLKATGQAMGQSLLTGFLVPLQHDAQQADQCYRTAAPSSNGCYELACGDAGNEADRLQLLAQMIQQTLYDVQYNQAMLLQGLPQSTVVVNKVIFSCVAPPKGTLPPPPCRQNMAAVIASIVGKQQAALALINDNASPVCN